MEILLIPEILLQTTENAGRHTSLPTTAGGAVANRAYRGFKSAVANRAYRELTVAQGLSPANVYNKGEIQMKTLTLLTLTFVLTAAMAVTTANAQQYVHTDTLTGHTHSVIEIAFKGNGTLISGGDDNTLRAWNVTTGTQRWSKDVSYPVWAVALPSHDPHFIAYGGNVNSNIRMRYSDDGDFRGLVEGHTGHVLTLAFKPNSYRLASGSADGTIRIWDVGDRDNLRHLHTLRGHTSWVESVAWSPDGRTLASGSHDGTVRLWNPSNGINFAVLRGHTKYVYSVAWSPDGRILASGSNDSTIRLWDPDTHGTLRVLQGHSLGLVR